jgi:hypothetical protein
VLYSGGYPAFHASLSGLAPTSWHGFGGNEREIRTFVVQRALAEFLQRSTVSCYAGIALFPAAEKHFSRFLGSAHSVWWSRAKSLRPLMTSQQRVQLRACAWRHRHSALKRELWLSTRSYAEVDFSKTKFGGNPVSIRPLGSSVKLQNEPTREGARHSYSQSRRCNASKTDS